MTLAQPNGKANLPTIIKSQPNGAVDTALLSWVEEGQKSLIYLMADLPARSMRAWHAYLAGKGLDIRTTGRGRTLAQQWQIFGGSQARYKPVTLSEYSAAPAANRKTWPIADYISSVGLPAPGRATVAHLLGVTITNSVYWIKIKQANGGYPSTAAVPGTSNHGFWCADDLAEYVNGKLLGSIRASTLQVLYASGATFGFTWSTASENWHVDWAHGDSLTQATIDFEGGTPAPAPGPVPTPTPTPVDSDLVITIYHLSDADAQFIALTTKAGVALHVEWTGPGTDPDVVQRLDEHIRLGAQIVTVSTADIKNCVLDGPLPQGDNKKVWARSDFFQPLK